MLRFAASLTLALVSWSVASAVEVELPAQRDNTLYQSTSGNLSNGAGNHFFTGRTAQPINNLRRGLIRFDLSSIPAGSTIDSVSLTLNMSITIVGDKDCSLHRALAAWGESTSTASGGEGGGGLAQPGDATWLHTFSATDFWTTPGGDFAAAPSQTTTVGAIGSYTWGSSAQLVADVQFWLDMPGENFGWVLVGDETGGISAKRFDTHENPNPANHPRLVINYTPPVGTDPAFSRGDCNADGAFNIADAVSGLGILFSGDPAPSCVDACDANDDGAFDIGDMIYLLANLFSGGAPIPAPTACDVDPTADSLDCAAFTPCP